MKIFINKDIRSFFLAILAIMAGFILISQCLIWFFYEEIALWLFGLSLLATVCVLLVCFCYFHRQFKVLESAVSLINDYLAGNTVARIKCDEEGELYKLFHSINTLAAVLNAHAENEQRRKEFLKNTISDISHQLKTPLAALNIYNELLQGAGKGVPSIKEFTSLSEQELDRMDALVQSLLKIIKLDADTMIIKKASENLADMMKDIELLFAYRAKQEEKNIALSGADDILLFCDRDWMIEAVSNIIKNALDHTGPGGQIYIEWKQLSSVIRITIKDNGSGIHPEDIHHIFKRFYRSRFSKDTQGIGLGLSLAKAIVESHDGMIAVDSNLGGGSTFVINFFESYKTVS